MELTNNIHQREGMFLKIMAGVGGREGGKEEGERGVCREKQELGLSAGSWHLSLEYSLHTKTLYKPHLISSFFFFNLRNIAHQAYIFGQQVFFKGKLRKRSLIS